MDWEAEARNILKGLMGRQDVGFMELAVKLSAIGVDIKHKPLSNKVMRGKFSFAFFLQCLVALGVDKIEHGIEPALARKG